MTGQRYSTGVYDEWIKTLPKRDDNAEVALREYGIAGIYETFKSPADAILQMARYIKAARMLTDD